MKAEGGCLRGKEREKVSRDECVKQAHSLLHYLNLKKARKGGIHL